MRSILDGTKAGEHYEALLAHFKEDLSRWAAERERNSPEAEKRRLDEKSRLRREHLLQRAIRKAEIDHIWRAKQSGSN